MVDSASGPHVQLHDFTIRSPLPLPKMLRHPSRLALTFSVNGVGKEVLSTRGDTKNGIWEADGDVKLCEDQLLTTTILVCIEDSTKELGTMTVNYSRLFAHAEARSRECYEFTVDGSTTSVIVLVTCYIRTLVPLPRKQYIFTGKSKSNKGRIGSNRALTSDASSSILSVADLELYYRLAASLPAKHKPQVLNAIGCAYQSMYNMTYKMGYLERAVSILGEALQNSSSYLRLPGYLSDLAACLLDRFERTGSHNDIEHAVSTSQDAVHNAKMSDPNRHRYISQHASALLARFRCLGKLEDLQNSILFMNTAIGLLPDGHPGKPGCLNNLGIALEIRFGRLGRVEDLDMAVVHKQKAFELTPDGHSDKPSLHNNLGTALNTRFDQLGNVKDLETAIAHYQRAVDLTPDDHPAKPRYLDNLGTAFKARFVRSGHIKDLEIAITHNQKAVNLTLDGQPYKQNYLINLGNDFMVRFDRLGHVEDLETAIVHKQKAVDLTPEGHPNMPKYLHSLGGAFEIRFSRLGRVEDLEMAIGHLQKALDLTPDDRTNNQGCLDTLGATLRQRFDQLGRVEDLEIAIAHSQKAVDLTPEGHPTKPQYLDNLGTAFMARFLRSGHMKDLEIAIAHKQKAVDLTPNGHPDKPDCLNNLGSAFRTRFDRLGYIKDLEIAIMHNQKAVDLTPDGHPDKPLYLNNLGNGFITQFDWLGHIKDLQMAMTHMQKAIDLTPDSHPDKQGRLNNLGIAFKKHFDWFGRVEDAEMAITHQQKAVDLTPDGHPDKPGYLNNLGSAFQARFDRLGHVEDLETAIAHEQKAVDMMPDGHPDKSRCFSSLGITFEKRFDRLGHVEDLETALRQHSTAASLPTASPRVRIDAARYWAKTSKLLETFGVSISSPLEPYHVTIDLLPRVAWLGIPMSTQHTLLEGYGETVRKAVSTAIKVEEYETAVEWAEAGRSIAWQNLLNLRTPVSELRSAHYDLAERLEAISRQLDMSVRGGDGQMNGAMSGMEEVSRSHVQLALDWDNTVADIRSKPGFESFLKPKNFNQLGHIARDGPVAILNITKDRCDALVLIPEDNGDVFISNILLDGFSYAKSIALLKELKSLLSSKHLRARDSRKARRIPIDDGNGPPLGHILRCLWMDLVKPIIAALEYQLCISAISIFRVSFLLASFYKPSAYLVVCDRASCIPTNTCRRTL